MFIVKLEAFENGAHRSRNSDILPDGYAMIPEDFPVPDTFPFVSIEAEEATYYNEVETPMTREVSVLDNEGNPILDAENNPVTETEEYMGTERRPYTMMTVTKMTPGVVPEPVERVPEPTQLDRIEAQVTYTAMCTDTLLEV